MQLELEFLITLQTKTVKLSPPSPPPSPLTFLLKSYVCYCSEIWNS